MDGLDPQSTMAAVSLRDESQSIVADVVTSLTRERKKLHRGVKKKVEDGLRKVKQISISK